MDFFLMAYLGRTGLAWDISMTICPHQMAAVGFEPLTLGFWGMAPTHYANDADYTYHEYNTLLLS